MKIVIAPHKVLRQKAKEVEVFDKKFFTFAKELAKTLLEKENPRGVGLAAPQVNKSWRVFVAVLGEKNQESERPELEFFINPRLTKFSPRQILGAMDGSERFEGCLSIPLFYGPVPRYEWVEVEYQSLDLRELQKKGQAQILNKMARFADFDARIVQHEYDHLEGILFTDYTLKNNLPIYVTDQKGQWVEVENKKEVLQAL
jgi:peptide deformylase